MERIDKSQVKNFVLGGNATITLESGVTGKYYTYKIKQHKNDKNLYFVRLLRGQDNENDYTFIGCYFADTGYFHPEKKYQNKEDSGLPKSLRAIKFLFRYIDNVPDQLHVYHNGRCCRCGRTLTTPESIKKGIGPECEAIRYEEVLIERNERRRQ